tara:strand:+ start:1055 stop:1276 length:222 start_codon:yes stop_codon:yes gene_type:complete
VWTAYGNPFLNAEVVGVGGDRHSSVNDEQSSFIDEYLCEISVHFSRLIPGIVLNMEIKHIEFGFIRCIDPIDK